MGHAGINHQDKIDALFAPPPPTTEQEQAQDMQAQSLVENSVKIMETLAYCPKTREQLNTDLAMGGEEIARTLHYVTKRVSPPLVDKLTTKDSVTGQVLETKYFLTEAGRIALPPSFFESHSKTRGQKHIPGMVGKAARNSDGSLNLKGLQGKVYDYIKTHPYSTSKDVMKGTGLPEKSAWALLGRLLKFKLIDFSQAKNNKNHTTRQYFIPGFHEGQSPEEKEQRMMRDLKKSLAKTATQPEAVAVETSRPQINPATIAKALDKGDTLTTSINELFSEGYTPTDIILTVLATMEAELSNLQKLRATMGDVLKIID